jgi:hypothetical protein
MACISAGFLTLLGSDIGGDPLVRFLFGRTVV